MNCDFPRFRRPGQPFAAERRAGPRLWVRRRQPGLGRARHACPVVSDACDRSCRQIMVPRVRRFTRIAPPDDLGVCQTAFRITAAAEKLHKPARCLLDAHPHGARLLCLTQIFQLACWKSTKGAKVRSSCVTRVLGLFSLFGSTERPFRFFSGCSATWPPR